MRREPALRVRSRATDASIRLPASAVTTSPSPPPGRGLSASELALAAAELATLLVGAELLDVAPLQQGDDLLLVWQQGASKQFLHVALGNRRARVVTTARRFRRDEQQTGPRADALRRQLGGARCTAIVAAAGERRLTLHLGTSAGPLSLHVELFSARGLWVLVDGGGRVLELSRPVVTAVRTLAPGDRYAPPPPRAAATGPAVDEPPPRFQPPVLAAIDAWFTADDRIGDAANEREQLRVHADRAVARAQKKAEGLRTQLQHSRDAPLLRAEADLMLAYLHTVARGATSMTVPDPSDGNPRTIALDPAVPARVQASARYERARRLEDGLLMTEQRLATADAELRALAPLAARLAAATELAPAMLDELRQALQALGAIPAPKAAVLPKPKSAAKAKAKAKGRLAGENLRRFTSVEGYEILVGRNNQQNDKLTLRIANGNDVWLHIGGGRPGSHVVVRLPKGKTASLETLLDAGHLAVHFSKTRGERSVEVLYTFAKHVRKPKGLPPGAVVPAQGKSLLVRLDESRLRRLLDSQPDAAD